MSLTSTQKKDTNTVELEIAVDADKLKAATDKVFRRKVKTIAVPGFRKGKAPRGIIERVYGEGVFLEDAVNDLYPDAYREAVDEAGIEPVDRADIEILSLDKDAGFTFKATVTVKPEVTVGEYKGLKAEKENFQVKEEDVDAEIDRMRERNARMVNIEDRPAKNGDITLIDFEGFVDDVAFEGGKGDSQQLTLGSGQFIPGFEEQIVGHSIGEEFDVNVTFPEEYHAEELKGKAAVFKVKLHEIKQKELPELDDEFAKDVSEYDTLDDLKKNIREKQQEAGEHKARDDFENALVDQIVEGLEGEIPEVMYDNKVDEMIRDFEYRLSSQGMQLDLYLQYTGMDMDSFRKTFRLQAVRQVKIRLALEKIAQLENMEATDEDREAELKKMSEAYGTEVDKLKDVVPEKELSADIKCTKAIDLIRDSAVQLEKTEKKEEAGEDKAEAEEKPKRKRAAKKADSDEAGEETEKPKRTTKKKTEAEQSAE